MTSLNPKILSDIKSILSKYLTPQDQAFIFGSRATGTARKWSDIDIGIIPSKKMSAAEITDEFIESDIPYRIEVVNFNNVTPEFKQVALSKIIPL